MPHASPLDISTQKRMMRRGTLQRFLTAQQSLCLLCGYAAVEVWYISAAEFYAPPICLRGQVGGVYRIV